MTAPATQFVQLKCRTINVAYIRSYQPAPDGTVTVHIDREPVPFIVPADEAAAFLAVVETAKAGAPAAPAAPATSDEPKTPAPAAGLKELKPGTTPAAK